MMRQTFDSSAILYLCCFIISVQLSILDRHIANFFHFFMVHHFKVHPEGKFVVDIDKNIDMNSVTPNCRVALRNDSYVLHKILPNKASTSKTSLYAQVFVTTRSLASVVNI